MVGASRVVRWGGGWGGGRERVRQSENALLTCAPWSRRSATSWSDMRKDYSQGVMYHAIKHRIRKVYSLVSTHKIIVRAKFLVENLMLTKNGFDSCLKNWKMTANHPRKTASHLDALYLRRHIPVIEYEVTIAYSHQFSCKFNRSFYMHLYHKWNNIGDRMASMKCKAPWDSR